MSTNDYSIKVDFPDEVREALKEMKAMLAKMSESHPPKKFLRSKELSALLGISESSLQNLRLSGVLPYKKIQGTLLYDYSEVISAIESHSFNKKTKQSIK